MDTMESFAPGRVELLGNHTDYNEGRVLAAALDVGVTMRGRRSESGGFFLRSEDLGRECRLDAGEIRPCPDEPWANYLLGVVHVLRVAGHPVEGLEASFSSTVPMGSGLSSSAAIEVATAMLVARLYALEIPPMEVAKLCRRAENEFVGVNCGLLDQATSVFGRRGHAVLLDCREETVGNVPIPDGLSLLVFHSAVEHRLTGGEYNERRESCMEAARLLGVRALRDADSAMLASRAAELPDTVLRRARHVVGECERVDEGEERLRAGDGEGFGRLMFQSHESSRVDFENSTAELDTLVELASGIDGVLGSRLTGGGFGGATVSLVRGEAFEDASATLAARYFERTGIKGRALRCSVGDGAH